jgi:lipid II:glycine glycyltransferase (peptidoglycan interpeptide bridge formation enzyme)
LIDLTQSTEVLLGNFKQKTRYNTRLAEKKGVTCEIVSLDRFEDLVRLMQQTAERDHFHLHSLDHYKIMLETLNTDQCRAFLAMAFYEGRPLAANVMIDAFGTRTYLHGASSNLYRNVMAPYALHKFLILDAQSQGLATYDFWGIAPPGSDDNHPWAGITRFKAGFGGRTVTMPGTFDVAKQPLVYWAYRLAKGLRR